MKRLLTLALALALVLSLAACGGKEEPADTETDALTLTQEGELLLNIPADMMKGVEQEDLDQAVEAGTVLDATLNDDGTVTYRMTEEQHRALLDEIGESIDLTVEEMVSSGEYPAVTEIRCNEDYTHFTVTTHSQELSLDESFATVMFYMNGGMYNIFKGTPDAEITVDYVNAESGEIITSTSSLEDAPAEE